MYIQLRPYQRKFLEDLKNEKIEGVRIQHPERYPKTSLYKKVFMDFVTELEKPKDLVIITKEL